MMKQNADPSAKKLAAVVCAFAVAGVMFFAVDALAKNKVKGEHANSRSPVYKVGDLNAKLSRLCRQGLFKQHKLLRLSIGYIGDKGKGITGIAKQDWNLYDPTGASEADKTYHFFNQGYSNCRVYVAVTPPPRPPAPPR